MKIECTQDNLRKGLSLVSKMIGTKTTLPVLANVLLKTENGRLKLSATNLEIGISTFIGGKVSQEGAITLPARLLSDFMATNTDKNITLNVKDEEATITSSHYTASIKGIVASEFPTIPEISREVELEISAPELREAILKTAFAAATEETRPILAGILMRVKKGALHLVATDSFRLAERKIILSNKNIKELDVVVPARTMVEVARLLEEGGEVVNIRVGDNQIAFSFDETYLVSRIVEGAYPDYEQIIPKTSEIKAVAPREELANAIKMSNLFARDAAGHIKIRPQKIELLASSPQLGENKSVVNGAVTGGELDIAFNARYILDALQVIPYEKVELGFIGKLNPCVLRAPLDKNYLYIIMPLRVET
jgi:DNA polymerase-3 subunit beta